MSERIYVVMYKRKDQEIWSLLPGLEYNLDQREIALATVKKENEEHSEHDHLLACVTVEIVRGIML